MIAYLAGPMRGYPRFNFDAFEATTAQLRAAGLTVISPHEMDLARGFDPDSSPFTAADYSAAMRLDVAAILTVDLVVTLRGWALSEGACTEVAVARAIGLPILTPAQALIRIPLGATPLPPTS